MNIKVTKENFLDLDRTTQQEYTARMLTEGFGAWFTHMHEEMQKMEVENAVFDIENMVEYPELNAVVELTNAFDSRIGNRKLSRVTAWKIVEDLKL